MVYVFLAEGFEELEALAPVDLLRRVDVEVATVSLTDELMVQSSRGIFVKADITLELVDFEALEMLVVPGGLGGVNSIESTPAAMDLIHKVWKAEKLLAAICAAPRLLAKLDLVKGLLLVCHPSVNNVLMNAGGIVQHNKQVVFDGNLIKAKAAGSSIEFALELVAIMRDTDTATDLRHAIT